MFEVTVATILCYLYCSILSVTVILEKLSFVTSSYDEGNESSDPQSSFCSPVKPSPPTELKPVIFPNKTLSVSWKRPHLPAYHLQYELRYVPMHGMADVQWKVKNRFSTVP